MKELWLMSKSSLYCDFIDQNEQRINNGEIDLMYFPSNMLAFNTSKLPLDLHDEKEINICLEYAFGQREHLRELFGELADLNVAQYDKIGVYRDHSANDAIFCEMIHYFVDADILIKYCDQPDCFVATAELRREMEENYNHVASADNIFLREESDGLVKYCPVNMVLNCLLALLDEDPTKVSDIVKKFSEKYDPVGDIDPRFLAKILAALACAGAIKAYKQGELYTEDMLLESSGEAFLYQARVKKLSEEEMRQKLNEIEEFWKKIEVA